MSYFPLKSITLSSMSYEQPVNRPRGKRISFTNLESQYFIRNSWVSTASLLATRSNMGGTGSQNAAISMGGYDGTTLGLTTVHTFNGNAWVNNYVLSTGRYTGGSGATGIQYAAIIAGGQNSGGVLSSTEYTNGSSFSSAGTLLSARSSHTLIGIQRACIAVGYNASGACDLGNGNFSTWIAGPVIPTTDSGVKGCGTVCAGLAQGQGYGCWKLLMGFWSTTVSTTVVHSQGGMSGTINAAIVYGGADSSGNNRQTVTESFNGYIWSTMSANLSSARFANGSAGSSQNSALSIGGYTTVTVDTVEKFIGSPNLICKALFIGDNVEKYEVTGNNIDLNPQENGMLIVDLVVDHNGNNASEKKYIWQNGKVGLGDGVWSSTGSLSTPRSYLAGAGTQSASLASGGYSSSASGVTEYFNGSSWGSTGSLNTARYYLVGSGTKNAALNFGGTTTGSDYSNVTEKFNINTWATSTVINTARTVPFGCGVQNATLCGGGYTGATSAVTERFNGSTWTVTGSMTTARLQITGTGTINAALNFGGDTSNNSGVVTNKAEKFNGSTWSLTTNINVARYATGACGTQNSTTFFGGYSSGASAITEKFNGLVWVASGSLGTSRYGLSGSGSQNTALSYSGTTGSVSGVTEKFNSQLTLSQMIKLEIK